MATEEPYVNELKGSQVVAGSDFTVADEKFGNATAWSSINQNISVNDIVSFEINFDSTIYFYDKPFACTLNFKIYVYGNTADSSQITDSVTYNNLSLVVKYDTVTGKPYKGIALYKFKNVYKFRIKILGISSSELSPIPAIFRVKGQVIVDREYNFQNTSSDVTRFSVINTNQLRLEWTPSNYPGAQMFDIEYTHIDDSSAIATSIRNNFNTGTDEYTVPADTLNQWFQNNSTRITTTGATYQLDIPYNSGFILFRIRGVLIHYSDGVRWEGDWNYSASWSTVSCSSSCPTGVVHFADHEPTLNWQYSAVFAEEGKRKEVMSYFSGTLHNRQSVTISNTENRAIVQETIYDILGRPAMNVLPAPTNDSTIHYYKNFNRNSDGDPYSFADYSASTNCTTDTAGMSNTSGASKYYSENNDFLSQYYFSKYIPKAENYPFAVTEYMADNTGRISMQGGVGKNFQINSGHETKYYYGKPTSQNELDRLFGVEAGNFTHYLKNMVIDPNGQISVSYIEPGGKTVATALAGAVPANLHALPSSSGASTTITNELINPDDFTKDGGNYSLTASSTFLAPVTGTYILNYRIDPLKLSVLYGPDKDSVICSTCYYDLDIIVKDNCNNTIREETRPAGTVFDTACSYAGTIQDTIGVNISKIGDYYVTYSLKVSKDALDYYDSVHLVKNSDILKFNSFLLDELKQTDFTGCYNNCQTCLNDLGTKQEFYDKFKVLYQTDSVFFGAEDSVYTLDLYDSLLSHCQSIQATCNQQQSVCDEKLDILKTDVKPGGQYALYDSNFHLLDTATNVLSHRNRIVFFPDGFGGRDSVTLKAVGGEDSVKVDVKDLSDSLFMANWKDAWADSLVRLHPEYCYYLWCIANSNSHEFDKEIENWEDADTAINNGWFNPKDYKALLNKDPFFNTFNEVSGKGTYLHDKMEDSLRLFSRSMVRFSQSDKNILQVVDIALYCKNQYNGWDDCSPDSACRSRNREWFLYKHLYLNLKQRFYEEARRNDPQFATCTNCFIGKDLLQSLPTACPDISDFSLKDSLGSKKYIFYKDQDNGVPYDVRVYIQRKSYSFLDPDPNSYTIDTVNRIITKGQWYTYLTYTSEQSDFKIVSVTCLKDSSYSAFTDSTCNYQYPGGIYHPYDRDSLSFYIHYGSPYQNSDSVPATYGNCQFYPVFTLKTALLTRKNFFNVWVCVHDSACAGGICPADYTNYSSQCSSDTNASKYKDKIRRYPEYVNATDFINSTLAGNPQQSSQDAEQQGLNECHSNCEAQADYWISTLKKCTLDSAKLAQLRLALIDICSRGCAQNNAFGASSVGYYQKIEAEDWTNMSGVLLEPTLDYGSGLDVGYIDPGDWMDYQVDIPASGTYKLNFRVATVFQGDSFVVKNSEGAVLAVVKAPTTHSFQVFRTVSVTINLSAGVQTLRLESLNGGWNFNWFSITGNPVIYRPIPTRIEGEAYDAQGGSGIEAADDPQGGDLCAVLYQNSSWVDYHVQVPVTGTYTANLRLECIGYLQQLQIKNSAGTVLATVTIPQTGYNNYVTVSTNINLSAGNETLRIENITSVSFALNWIELQRNDLPFAPAPYFSFEDAIRGVLGDGAINDSCTVDLLSNPYPYDKAPFYTERLISETNYDICQKITQYKNEWTTSGFSGSLHQYLKNKLGVAYQIDSTELDDLMNSCTRCNGILNDDISLPIAFEPGAHPCLSCSEMSTAKGLFAAKYPGIDSTSQNYEILFTNFMNHRFGFSLSYDEYDAFSYNCEHPSGVIRVEAESYNSMSGVATEGTSDIGGGQDVGFIDYGDWMDYGVTLPATANYKMSFRVASPGGAQLQVKNSTGTVLATVDVPSTGGWQNWQTVTTSVALPAGSQTLRIYASEGGWNINWFELTSPTSTLYASLCDHVAQPDIETDAVNSCTSELFATAMTNGQNRYIAYIDSVRREFRNAYMTKCMNVQPSLKMTAELYEYHYTLYYYDQSGNLVKTVPPEGVTLLTSAQIDTVQLYRRLQSQGCYQYSDSVHFNNNGSIQFPAIAYNSSQPFTLEARVNLASASDQTILSQISEVNAANSSFGHKGYILSVANNKLQVSLYSYLKLGELELSDTAIAISSIDLGQLLPLNTWKHLVLEYTGNYHAPWSLYIDGNPVALQYTQNSLTSLLSVAGSPFIIGSHLAPNLANPGMLVGTIKNLRIYSRLLGIDEIRQNAYNNCQTPSNNTGLVLWTPLNSADSNIVRDLVAKQDGTLTGFAWQPFIGIYNDHRLVTTYQYNSLNQVVQQYSPDGDTTQFFYDRLGRLTVSQNKEQQTTDSYSGSANRFSYTMYDALGRINEVGEKSGASSDIRSVNMLDTTAVKTWLASGTNRQITKTIYDSPVNPLQTVSASRKRVTASIYLENASDTEGDSTLYVYDISGNVKTLIQHVKALVAADPTNGKKRIDYDYDLVSGKVNMVSYQEDKGDQFFYKYLYDADNRVIQSLSSRDKLIWTDDASYMYYLHGSLARTELGHWKVQGIDYAYTLQGWLKGINGDALNPNTEMAGDGNNGSIYSRVSRDVYAFKLGYHANDYKPIGGMGAPGFDQYTYTAPTSLDNTGNQLFNGNISYSTLALSKFDSSSIRGYSYGYDQLNRLVEMRQHNVTGAWSNSNIISAYAESIAYDANGNILKYLRRGANTIGNPLDMDSLNYKYNYSADGKLINNQLNHVRDQVSSSNYAVDIDNQSPNNYTYDHIGNLKKDVAEGIDTIRWTVYGKINRIVKGAVSTIIDYGYDAGGNRTTKKVAAHDTITTTFYVRDAQGNVMGIYSKKDAAAVDWNEQDLYGSSRIGLWRWDTIVPSLPPIVTGNPIEDSLMIGSRNYELSNHLGNVLSTISDKKIGHDSSGVVNYYLAEVLTQNDYYPGGMQMPNRVYNSGNYRYGFNGKENDNEVKGDGNEIDYGMRVYDPRIVKFLSVDPLSKKYPWNSPYSYAEGDMIRSIDLDGLEKQVANAPLGFYHEGGAGYQKMEFRGNYYVLPGHTSSLFRVVDYTGNNYWVKEKADLVNGYGNIKTWKKTLQYWTEEPNTTGYSPSAHWEGYKDEGQRATDDARSFEEAVGKAFIYGTVAVSGGLGLASLEQGGALLSQGAKIAFNAGKQYATTAFRASWAARGISAGGDAFTQYYYNIQAHGYGLDNLGHINGASVLASGLAPGSDVISPVIGSTFEFNFSQGYRGLGSGQKTTWEYGTQILSGIGGSYIGGKYGKYLGTKSGNTLGGQFTGNLIGNFGTNDAQQAANQIKDRLTSGQNK